MIVDAPVGYVDTYKWLRLALEQGDPKASQYCVLLEALMNKAQKAEAFYRLSGLYAWGGSIEEDRQKGYEFLWQAAGRGHAGARADMAKPQSDFDVGF